MVFTSILFYNSSCSFLLLYFNESKLFHFKSTKWDRSNDSIFNTFSDRRQLHKIYVDSVFFLFAHLKLKERCKNKITKQNKTKTHENLLTHEEKILKFIDGRTNEISFQFKWSLFCYWISKKEIIMVQTTTTPGAGGGKRIEKR